VGGPSLRTTSNPCLKGIECMGEESCVRKGIEWDSRSLDVRSRGYTKGLICVQTLQRPYNKRDHKTTQPVGSTRWADQSQIEWRGCRLKEEEPNKKKNNTSKLEQRNVPTAS